MISGTERCYRLAIALALFVLICGVPLASAGDNNESVGIISTTGISDNSSILTSSTEPIPVTTVTEIAQNTTLLQTMLPTLTAIISPIPTTVTETKSVETATSLPTVTPEKTITPTVTLTARPNLVQKSFSPSVQRKISTNLLYVIDSNTPQTGQSRDAVQNQMETEGKLKTVMQTASSSEKQGLRAVAVASTTQACNLVLVYIDLVPTASTTAIDAYVSSFTERNEQEHSVVAWVDINNLETLASLDAVSNIRTAEPSVTKESPVYHDTKFVNKRAGMPPLTAEGAKASVREFERAPGMQLEQKRTMTTPRGNVYEMASDSGRYFVNAKTGEVELMSLYGKQKNTGLLSFLSKTSSASTDSGPVTVDQAFAIAQDYGGKNYRNFYDRTMVLTESKLVDHGAGGKTYYFTWREEINNVVVSNGLSVTIDATNGNILSYINIDQPIDADIIPTISKDQAITKAIFAFSPIDVTKSGANLAVIQQDDNSQRLVWLVEIIGSQANNSNSGGYVIVDAKSGTFVGRNAFL